MGYRPLPLTGPQLERNHESVSDVRDAPRPARAPGGLTHRATMYSIQREHRLAWQRSVSRRGEACCKTSSVAASCSDVATALPGSAALPAAACDPLCCIRRGHSRRRDIWHTPPGDGRRPDAPRSPPPPGATWRHLAPGVCRVAVRRPAKLRSLAGAAARGARGRQPRSSSAAAQRRSGGGERSVRSGW